MLELTQATHVWLVDFEFRQPDGFLPTPICLVAREWRTGRTIRSWLTSGTPSPFQFGPDDVLVAYYASAEISCFLALGWDLPRHILDLYPEFRWMLGGRSSVAGFGLLGALTHFGISNGVSAARKDEMRAAAQGNAFSAEDQLALLDYCESDVELGTSVHLTLEQLELVDVAFRLPVAPAGGQRGMDGGEVLLHPGSEGLQRRHAAGARPVQPARQRRQSSAGHPAVRAAAGLHEGGKAARQRTGFSDLPILFDLGDRGLLRRVELDRRLEQQPGQLPRQGQRGSVDLP